MFIGSVSKSQRRCQLRCQEADNVSSQRAYRVVTVSAIRLQLAVLAVGFGSKLKLLVEAKDI